MKETPEREIEEREMPGVKSVLERRGEPEDRYWRIVVNDSDDTEAIERARNDIRRFEEAKQKLRESEDL